MKKIRLIMAALLTLGPQLLANESGKIKLNSNPAGATVYLDGTQVGVTPYEGQVDPGEHVLQLIKEGYRDKTWQQGIPEGGVVERLVSLKEKVSVLRITSHPATANVIVDGLHRGRTPLDVEIGSGEHELVLELKGHAPRREKFSSWDGGVKELDLKLRENLKTIQKFELGFLAGAGVASVLSIWANNRYNRVVKEQDVVSAYFERAVSRDEQLRYLREFDGLERERELYADMSEMALVTSIGCVSAAFLLYCYEDDHFYDFIDRFVFRSSEDDTVLACRLRF